MSAVVYRHFDSSGNLLYIGLSKDLGARTFAHESTASWFLQIAKITVTHFDSYEDAASAEKLAIKYERPMHNVAHTPLMKQKLSIARRPRIQPSAVLHEQLDNLKRWKNLGDHSLPFYFSCDMEHINGIRESGRKLSNLEISILRERLGVSYKRLEEIGISKVRS